MEKFVAEHCEDDEVDKSTYSAIARELEQVPVPGGAVGGGLVSLALRRQQLETPILQISHLANSLAAAATVEMLKLRSDGLLLECGVKELQIKQSQAVEKSTRLYATFDQVPNLRLCGIGRAVVSFASTVLRLPQQAPLGHIDFNCEGRMLHCDFTITGFNTGVNLLSSPNFQPFWCVRVLKAGVDPSFATLRASTQELKLMDHTLHMPVLEWNLSAFECGDEAWSKSDPVELTRLPFDCEVKQEKQKHAAAAAPAAMAAAAVAGVDGSVEYTMHAALRLDKSLVTHLLR